MRHLMVFEGEERVRTLDENGKTDRVLDHCHRVRVTVDFPVKGEMRLSSECCLGSEGYSQGELGSRLGNLQQGLSGVRVIAK